MPHGRSHAADEPLVGGALREMLDLVVQGDMRQCQLELVGGEEAAWAVICSSAFLFVYFSHLSQVDRD